MVKTIILIPAYKPETKMLDLLEALRGKSSSLSGGDRAGNSDNQIDGIVVVDDGGQEAYRDLFAKAEDMGCLVVHHEVNRGKGAAIRTGIRFAMEHFGEEIRIVTADADGQHTPEDILRVAGQVKANDSSAKPVLVLGVRDFSGIDVPARSMLGNRITALCFRISTGISCADTQTGLRGISAGLLPLALSVDGDRYDYEMNFLTEAVRRARLIQIPIRTVYEEGNKTSHFRPVRDSLLIYRKPIRYLAVGAGSAVVDWFLFLLINPSPTPAIGRFDQYMYPFYKADIESGRLTPYEAFDLAGCMLIKMSEMMWITSEGSSKFFAGYQPFVNMCVGGLTREGRDATNDLTYLLMDAVRHVKIYQPSLATRVHNKTPHRYMEKIVDVVRAGMGFPAVHFDDCHIKMMLAKGVSLEDARDYCLMGCVEPQKAGRLYQWTSTAYTQWPICIELVLNRGVPLWFGKPVCPDMGPLESFDTFEKFDSAVKEVLKYITRLTGTATVISQRVHRELAPKPLMSLMYEGCMESGRDVSSGGAMYNFGPGVVWSGLATYADSMAAIKKLVYDEGKYSLAELNEALKADFQGFESVLRDCLEAPKYGNDDPYADDIAADIIEFTETEHRKIRTLYSTLSHGTLSISNNTPFGMLTGASANGRRAWTPLSDGISPTQGADKKGPTAIIKSVSRLACDNMNIGMVHNFKLMAGLLETPEGKNGLIALLRAASIFGNGEMQFNYLDNKTLVDAQEKPKEHRDLVVRVAGYSAFFVELCQDVQNEIISRTMLTRF